MSLDRESTYILILLCIPLQFNLLTDSLDLIVDDMKSNWVEKTDLTYYERYFSKKVTMYAGLISSISFIFIFYKILRMKLIISITFLLNGITWLFYFAMNENRTYLLYVIRSLQGIYLGCFQITTIPFILNFAVNSKKCFCGSLIQFSMFVGLFLMNLLFVYFSWNVVIIIFFVLSLAFSGLIWLVPEIYIVPKSITKEYVNKRENIRLLIIMLLTMLLQQMSGIGTLLQQLSDILSGIGLDIDNNLQACLFNFVGAIAVINSAFMSDVLSSKYMWVISSIGLCIGLAIYAATLKSHFASWIRSLAVFFYFLFYGLGQGPIPWYLCGTMMPEGVRLESTGINLAWNMFLSPLMDVLLSKFDEAFGQFGSILFSSVSCFVAVFFGFFVMPSENQEDIDNINIL